MSLESFVRLVCGNRDSSHGYDHAKNVADNAAKICESLQVDEDIRELVNICAWLHDVADHKYDQRDHKYDQRYYEHSNVGLLQRALEQFLLDVYPDKARLILAIIERISYSRQIEHGSDDWMRVLGEKGLLVRNIVSDADKLEAINLERCVSYTRHRYPSISRENLKKEVTTHANEKLLRLKDEFIYTIPAKVEAERLHLALIADLQTL